MLGNDPLTLPTPKVFHRLTPPDFREDRVSMRDDRAFADLVQHHDRSLRTLGFVMLGDAERTDAALQRGVIDAYASLPDADDPDGGAGHSGRDAQPPAGLGWLARFVYAAARDDARRTGRNPLPGPPGGVAAVLAGLMLDDAALVVLVDAEGLDPDEGAAIVGLRPTDAASRLEHARAAVRGVLRPPPVGPATVAGRDVAVGTALRGLAVPDHGPSFWPRLGADLLALREPPPDESSSSNGGTPTSAVSSNGSHPLEENPADEVAEPVVPEGIAYRIGPTGYPVISTSAPRRALPAVRPVRVAPTYSRVRTRSDPWSSRRVSRPAIVVLAVVATLAALVAVRFGRHPHAAGPSTEAIAVASKVSTAWANAETVQGAVATTTYGAAGAAPATNTAAFAWRADGSFRLAQADGTSDVAYDSTTGTRRQFRSDGTQASGVEETGLPPGPPDLETPPELPFATELRSALATWRTSPGVTVHTDTVDGQPVWVVTSPLGAAGAGGASAVPGAPVADTLAVTVDQHTALPLRLTRSAGSTPVDDVELRDVVVDQPVAADGFTVPFAKDLVVTRFPYQFNRLKSVDEMPSAAGYPVATPGYLPPGYELAEIAVAPTPGLANGPPAAGAAVAANPPSTGVATLLYRRGLETIVVTTRRAGDAPDAWTDPFGPATAPAPVTVNTTAYGRVPMEFVDQPGVPTHLWGVAAEPGLVVTVAGDVDRDTMLRVASSLGA
jgi:DNA-directed RNA polymerase specialized sigma24 family protein